MRYAISVVIWSMVEQTTETKGYELPLDAFKRSGVSFHKIIINYQNCPTTGTITPKVIDNTHLKVLS